jgi:hypothetical protein
MRRVIRFAFAATIVAFPLTLLVVHRLGTEGRVDHADPAFTLLPAALAAAVLASAAAGELGPCLRGRRRQRPDPATAPAGRP